MINYGAAWERYYELADRRNKEGLNFDEVVAVVNAARASDVDDLDAQLSAMTESAQRYALYFLWGTMKIRDPQRCVDALTAAAGW